MENKNNDFYCGKEDEVPEYVVEEFHYDLKEDEEVEVV